MIRMQGDAMGRFSVDVGITNHEDEVLARAGHLSAAVVRRATISAVVDSGAAGLVLPKALVDQLGLPAKSEVAVRFADGRRDTRPVVGDVHLSFAGRSGLFDAVVEPGRDDALLGAIVMEVLDLVIDCTHQKLSPRDPDRVIVEIE